jgi:hypothetical protein
MDKINNAINGKTNQQNSLNQTDSRIQHSVLTQQAALSPQHSFEMKSFLRALPTTTSNDIVQQILQLNQNEQNVASLSSNSLSMFESRSSPHPQNQFKYQQSPFDIQQQQQQNLYNSSISNNQLLQQQLINQHFIQQHQLQVIENYETILPITKSDEIEVIKSNIGNFGKLVSVELKKRDLKALKRSFETNIIDYLNELNMIK